MAVEEKIIEVQNKIIDCILLKDELEDKLRLLEELKVVSNA